MRGLEKTLSLIGTPDFAAMEKARLRWSRIAKPLHSLGKLEQMVIRLAGITGEVYPSIEKKAVAVFCGDHGVVAEGVTQTGQEVTAVVAENFLQGRTTVCHMTRLSGARVFAYDIGMIRDTLVDRRFKVRYGTADLAAEPAMSLHQARCAVEAGIQIAEELHEAGFQLVAGGEMGIGNTTCSSAVASVLTGQDPDLLTGRGAGLSQEGLMRKRQVIRQALALHRPDPQDPLDVLAKVGGLELAALTGFYLGSASLRMPVVLDGAISCTAALVSCRLCPPCREFLLPSHMSGEPPAAMILPELGLEPVLDAGFFVGEGTGAAALFPLLDMVMTVYTGMPTFEEIRIRQYEELK